MKIRWHLKHDRLARAGGCHASTPEPRQREAASHIAVPPTAAGTSRSSQCLILSDNWCLGRGGEGTFDALCGLPGLKRLEMADCSLRELPLELTCLQALKDLDLKVNVPVLFGLFDS